MLSRSLAPCLRHKVGHRPSIGAIDRKRTSAGLCHSNVASPRFLAGARKCTRFLQQVWEEHSQSDCHSLARWRGGSHCDSTMQSRLRLKRSPSFAGGAWSWHHCFKTRLSSRQQVRFAADAKSPDDGRQEQAQRHSETGTTSQGRQDSEQAKSESEMWSEMWRTKRDAETQALPQALRAQLDTISKLYRRAELSNAALFGGVAVMAVTSGFLYMNWQDVRQHVSKESAGMVAETIRDKQLQNDAHEFSKALLNHLLTDEEVSRTVARWTYGILQSLKNEIGDLFVHILALEQVVAAVNRLADRLVEHLCSSRTIQERVGKLLVDAICLETSRDAAARWAYDLVMRDDVKSGFRDLVVGALQTDAVVEEARGLAIQIVNTVLNDPNTQNEARRALNETLRDSELRATAKDSLWSIVMPWSGSSKATDKPVQKALKSLDDILMLDSLTQDEKQVLLSLQNRLRTEGEAPSRRHSKNVSVDAVASSAGAEHSPKEEAARKALEEKEAQEKAQRKAEEAAKKLADQRAAEEEAARKAAEQTEAKEKAERQEVARKALAEKIAKEEAERELAKRIAEEKAAKEEAARVAAARKAQEKAEREAEAARKAAEENAAKEAAELEAARRAAEEKAAEEQAKREAEELARKEAEETIARKLAEADAKKAMEEKVAKEKAELEEAEESARRNAAAEKKAVEDVARKLADEAAEQSALAREAEEKAVALQASSHEAAAAKAAEQTALAREAGERAAALREVAEEAAKEAAAKDAEQRKYSEEASKKIPGQPTAFQRFAEQAAQVVHGVVDPFTGESKPGDEDPTKTSR